jgi:hypothetical protein
MEESDHSPEDGTANPVSGLRSTILRMLEDGRLPASSDTLEHRKISRTSRQAYISKGLIKKVRIDVNVRIVTRTC